MKIPGVPDLKEEDLPSELEQKHLLCDGLKTLPCKRRGARQVDPACANLPARPPKTVDPRCPTGK